MITEGTARGGTREFVQFLTMAPGSLSELETQVLIARELGHAKETGVVDTLIEELFRILGGLIASLKEKDES
ncbi:MAG: four helix bundle protein [Burkholderiales bacterium]